MKPVKITDKEKRELIIDKLNEIAEIASELMDIAETGADGNLREMTFHIRIYSLKIIKHLLQVWRLNERVAKRREEKARLAALEDEE